MTYSIEHSGILGMKWGHRNGPPYPLGSDQKSSAEKTAEKTGESPNPDSNRYYTPKASDMWRSKEELSTKEIRDYLDRVDTERRLKDLVDKENAKSEGFVKRTLRETGTAMARNAINAGTTWAIGKAIEKVWGRDAAEAIAGDKYSKLNPQKKEYKLMDNEELRKNFDTMSGKEIGDMLTRQKLHDTVFGSSSKETKSSSVSEKVAASILSSAVSSITGSDKVSSKTSEFVDRVNGTRTDISQNNIDLAKQYLYGDDWFKHAEVE